MLEKLENCWSRAESTHENLFPNFYMINLPSIIGIQFIDGVGESIVGSIEN